MTSKRIVKALLISLLGFAIMNIGIAFSIKGALGTSPISSVPYVVSEISGWTVGTVTIALHCLFVLTEIVLLRKRFRLFQLTQVPVAIVFGTLTDLAIWCIRGITVHNYMQQWACCLLGVLLVGIGVSVEVTAAFVVVAGEGLVIAICEVWPLKFGTVKMGMDITLVCCAVILSLVFKGHVMGVREGTLAAALLVGNITKFCIPRLKGMKRWIDA